MGDEADFINVTIIHDVIPHDITSDVIRVNKAARGKIWMARSVRLSALL